MYDNLPAEFAVPVAGLLFLVWFLMVRSDRGPR